MKKNRFVGWVMLGLAAGLAGCAAPKIMYVPSEEPFSVPPINMVVQAPPGAVLLEQGVHRGYEAIKLDRAVAVGSFMLPPGVYLKESESTQAEFYSWDEVTSPTHGRGVQSGGLQLKVVFLPKGSQALCLQTMNSALFCTDDARPVRMRTTVVDKDAFQATLLYSGRVGSKVMLAYRESYAGRARPAFDNTAEYDLASSNILAYKGARLEVLEANNEGIRYRVLSNFLSK